jgi:hypothetical protein
MKIKILFPVLLLLCTFRLGAQEKYSVTWDYKNQSFMEFVARAESQLPVKFFYRDEWIADLKFKDSGCTSLPCVLDNLFRGTPVYYYIDDSGNIVITGKYIVKVLDSPVQQEQKFVPQADYSNSGKETQKVESRSVAIGNPADRNKPGNVTFSGYIKNNETKEPIAGVTVYIQKLSLGTIANEIGFYSLSLPRGTYQVQYSFVGLREKRINLDLYGSGEMNVEMEGKLNPLKEVVVSAQKNVTLQQFEVGAEKINIASVKLLPTSMGEADILKSIILIPGVKSVGEGSAGFNVRGGSADQNLILLYGAPVYNSSHFLGFFSAVNSDVIKGVTLYKGGIPSRYGGRISSVLDIESREGNNKEFAGNAGISPITTHLTAEGPIIKDTLTYLLSGRTTYSNWIFGVLKDPTLHNSRASFYDLNGKLTYKPNSNNKIDLSYYISHDYLKLNSVTTYSFDNNIIALKWQHFFTSKFLSVLSVNNSMYRYDMTNLLDQTEEYVMSHKINTTGIKTNFTWFKGRHEVNFGMDLNRSSVIPGSYRPASDSSLIIAKNIERERALDGAIYLDDKFTLTKVISINVGLRMSSFFSFGPKTVLTYTPGFSKSGSSVTDTIKFRAGEVSGKYAGPELRASINFKLTDRNAIKINYNRTRQYIHLLSNSTSISPTDTWKLCDYYLKPEIGDQFALGFYEMLFRNRVETSLELYYKRISNMIDFKGGSTLTMIENIEQYMIDARGKAYGLELEVKKADGKFRYSIGYSYSRTFIKSVSKYSEEEINSGNWYPANYDKPNDLSVTLQYLYSRRLSFSANYTYSTGRPITIPIATYRIGGVKMIQYSDRNKYRIPDYSRFDVSVSLSGNLKTHKIAHPNWTFSVYNLFSNQNAYSIFFKKEGEFIRGYKLSVFGTAIPSVTFSFDF